jgi:RNA polymerase sigma-70 factor, ECF subfamily
MMNTSAITHQVNETVPIVLEQQWIQAVRKGDLDAFNKLVLSYQDSLYSWVYYLVGDPDLAEDVTQSVFITAYEKISSFRNGSFKSWLFQIAKNRSIDNHRNNQRHPTISLNDPIDEENDQERLDLLVDRARTPGEQIELQEQAVVVQQLLMQLKEEYRSVLVLVDMNDMNYEEAAQALKIPLGTVKSRLVRARLKLRDLAVKRQLFG